MDEKQKELLFRDLCGRLEHDVMVYVTYDYDIDHEFYSETHEIELDASILEVDLNEKKLHLLLEDENDEKNEYFQEYFDDEWTEFYFVKPYLRPMESMTEEENKELGQLLSDDSLIVGDPARTIALHCAVCTDFFNKKMLDYRGLIEQGIALPAKEGMYVF